MPEKYQLAVLAISCLFLIVAAPFALKAFFNRVISQAQPLEIHSRPPSNDPSNPVERVTELDLIDPAGGKVTHYRNGVATGTTQITIKK